MPAPGTLPEHRRGSFRAFRQEAGGRPTRTVFTDVFDDRDGRWQAVNAQENPIEPGPAGAGG